MLLIAVYGLALSILVYLLTFKVRKGTRVFIALLVLLAVPLSAIIWVMIAGDKAPPGSITYDSNGRRVDASPAK
jgi:hypothetical protein